jgi:hypothetical protein
MRTHASSLSHRQTASLLSPPKKGEEKLDKFEVAVVQGRRINDPITSVTVQRGSETHAGSAVHDAPTPLWTLSCSFADTGDEHELVVIVRHHASLDPNDM